jgi:hypothetical protein
MLSHDFGQMLHASLFCDFQTIHCMLCLINWMIEQPDVSSDVLFTCSRFFQIVGGTQKLSYFLRYGKLREFVEHYGVETSPLWMTDRPALSQQYYALRDDQTKKYSLLRSIYLFETFRTLFRLRHRLLDCDGSLTWAPTPGVCWLGCLPGRTCPFSLLFTNKHTYQHERCISGMIYNGFVSFDKLSNSIDSQARKLFQTELWQKQERLSKIRTFALGCSRIVKIASCGDK